MVMHTTNGHVGFGTHPDNNTKLSVRVDPAEVPVAHVGRVPTKEEPR